MLSSATTKLVGVAVILKAPAGVTCVCGNVQVANVSLSGTALVPLNSTPCPEIQLLENCCSLPPSMRTPGKSPWKREDRKLLANHKPRTFSSRKPGPLMASVLTLANSAKTPWTPVGTGVEILMPLFMVPAPELTTQTLSIDRPEQKLATVIPASSVRGCDMLTQMFVRPTFGRLASLTRMVAELAPFWLMPQRSCTWVWSQLPISSPTRPLRNFTFFTCPVAQL